MARVCDLQAGDKVALAGGEAIFIARAPHPEYPALDLVIWRVLRRVLPDQPVPFWSCDALDPRQDVGEVVVQYQDKRSRFLLELFKGLDS